MRHRKRGRHLGRTPAHRKAMRRNLACSLIAQERVRTTPEKAKECRSFVEKLITLARKNTLAGFRRALALLDDKYVVRRLFREIGPRYVDRPGGYTRILKLDVSHNRLGDNAGQVIFELVTETEADVAAREEQRRRSKARDRLRRYEGEEPETAEPETAEPETEEPETEEPETEEPDARDADAGEDTEEETGSAEDAAGKKADESSDGDAEKSK